VFVSEFCQVRMGDWLTSHEERGQNRWFTAPSLYAEYAFLPVALCRVIFTLSLITGATCELSFLPSVGKSEKS
jgi:hypothetical protein